MEVRVDDRFGVGEFRRSRGRQQVALLRAAASALCESASGIDEGRRAGGRHSRQKLASCDGHHIVLHVSLVVVLRREFSVLVIVDIVMDPQLRFVKRHQRAWLMPSALKELAQIFQPLKLWTQHSGKLRIQF